MSDKSEWCKHRRPHCEQIGCDCGREHLKRKLAGMTPEEQKLAADRLYRAVFAPETEPDIEHMTKEEVHQHLLDEGFTEKQMDRWNDEVNRMLRMFRSGEQHGLERAAKACVHTEDADAIRALAKPEENVK